MENISFVCKECGEEVNYFGELDSKMEVMLEHELCEYCFDDKLAYCDLCEEYHEKDDVNGVYRVTDDDYILVCSGCMDSDDIIYCDFHERFEYLDDGYSSYEINNYGIICRNAFSRGGFIQCPICDDFFSDEDTQYSSDRDEYLCDSCYEEYERNQVIKGYHNHKDDYEYNMKLASLDGDTNLTYGFELEVESGRIATTEMAQRLSDISDFTVYEHDGSLSEGFEIISLPYDTEYLLKVGKDIIREILDTLSENGYKSHDTSTCGLHFHVGVKGLGDSYHSRNLVIQRIGCILEYFKEEITVLTRRTDEKLNRWSRFLTKEYRKEELDFDKIAYLIDRNNERYSALNLCNDNTIEFRLFRGTLKYETFMATWELVHNIVKYAKENEFNNLSELDYKTIFTYDKCEYIKEYMSKKKLIGSEVIA